jgi:glycosidase
MKTLVAVLVMVFSLNIHISAQTAGKPEVIYQLFQRSFYDSNGDGQGDLNGIRDKLDYLQGLGVNAVLLLPLYSSVFYHNYFADDFKKIDEEYGTMQDYISLVRAIHAHGMKVYLDMETQYVTEDHLWWKDAVGNLSSPYSDYILFDDSAHQHPASIVYGLNGLLGYDSVFRKITTVNLMSKKVLEYNYQLFKYFADPNGDGSFEDGADGFRLDHMMDTLDNKPQLAGLFKNFWTPLFTKLKQINPRLTFIAEQANWGSYGFDYLTAGNVDRVFDFALAFAIQSFDKNKIAKAAETSLNNTPPGKNQVVFIENHDVARFASRVDKNPGKERVGAALNLLTGGTPSIYYGQELGMFGSGGFGKFNTTDGNDIPQREAFEWYAADSGKGMALWYKNTGPWWDSTNLKPHDGISLEEEKNDPHSLFNFYRKLIALHLSNKAIAFGRYTTVTNDADSVLTFMRQYNDEKVLVAVNLSSSLQHVNINTQKNNPAFAAMQLLMGDVQATEQDGVASFSIQPYSVDVWGIQ